MKNNYLKISLVFIYTIFMAGMVYYFNRSFIGIDDANIYMVYMRNFSHGYGFVYNINSERVEGFTSLLWTLIGAFFYLFTETPEILFLITNILLVTYSLYRLLNFIDYFFEENHVLNPHTILFLGLMTIIPGYFEWTLLSYLETGLWSCLLILTTLNILEYKIKENKEYNATKFNLLLVLLVLCRPESVLWGISFLILKFFMLCLNRDRKIKIVIPLIVFLCSVSCLMIWRLNYFGFIFPNTYYAKVTTDFVHNMKDGIIYLAKYILINPLILVVLSLSVFYVYKSYKNQWADIGPIMIPFLVVLLSLGIPLYTGGDHFAFSRFIQPVVPVIWLLLLILLKPYMTVERKKQYISILLFLIVMVFIPKYNIVKSFTGVASPLKVEWDLAKDGRGNSAKLNAFFDKQELLPSQGVIPAGGMAYTYHGKTIDLLGLNSVAMAHSAKSLIKGLPKNHASFNKGIFYKLRPDVVWLSNGFIDNADAEKFYIHPLAAKILQNIFLDEEFKIHYTAVFICKKNSKDCLSIFASNKFLEKLNNNYSIKKYEIDSYSIK